MEKIILYILKKLYCINLEQILNENMSLELECSRLKHELDRKKEKNQELKSNLQKIKLEEVDAKSKIIELEHEILSLKEQSIHITLAEEVNKKLTSPGLSVKLKSKDKIDSLPTNLSKRKKAEKEDYKEIYVNYNIPLEFIQNEDWQYVVTKFPSSGSIVWPYRQKQIARRGYKEKSFEEIIKSFLEQQIAVYGDVYLLLQDGCRPYEPDIALVDKKSSIRIDIEIDEPYAGLEKIPIHYIGCNDDLRDINLINVGWIVVRFTEKQVHNSSIKCVAYIARLLHHINSNFVVPKNLESVENPPLEKRWTQIESQNLAGKKYRESYLGNTTFGKKVSNEYTSTDVQLIEQETVLLDKVKPITVFGNMDRKVLMSYNQSHSYPKDEELKFYPEKHIYTYHGISLISVSSAIESFFPVFDSDYWAIRKSHVRGCTPQEILEEWNIQGEKSRKIGTFMHLQIENYFLGNSISERYLFAFDGHLNSISSIESIGKELNLFYNFVQERNINSSNIYRTEWSIYDKKYTIAGTIDLLCLNNNQYEMYDWKRSSKLIDKKNSMIIKEDSYQKSGLGDLSNISDSSYYRYCLQQNLYRYILKENYDIDVDKMTLVILHSDYDKYICIDVPIMQKETEYILKFL